VFPKHNTEDNNHIYTCFIIQSNSFTTYHVIVVHTRLPSNLRPTTRECVYLLTHGHFRSRDKDGGNAIRSAISKNPVTSRLYVL